MRMTNVWNEYDGSNRRIAMARSCATCVKHEMTVGQCTTLRHSVLRHSLDIRLTFVSARRSAPQRPIMSLMFGLELGFSREIRDFRLTAAAIVSRRLIRRGCAMRFRRVAQRRESRRSIRVAALQPAGAVRGALSPAAGVPASLRPAPVRSEACSNRGRAPGESPSA